MSSARPVDAPRRILVRGPNWLGDLVMSTPGLRALRLAHPRARIVGLVPAGLAPLLDGSPDLDEVWSPSPGRLDGLRADARRIAAQRFDLGVAIPESVSSALAMRLGRVARIVGTARDPLRRVLLHDPVPAPSAWGRRRLVSKERFVLHLMAAVGASSSDTRLRLEVTPAEELRLGSLLGELGLGPGRPGVSAPVVIAPGASYGGSKCWPAERFAALADRLVARGESVWLVGTAAERATIDAVRGAMRARPVDLGGRVDLGMLKPLLRDARLLVANDAGARHVAAAFGVPSVIFFGPTAVAKTGEHLAAIEPLETEHACRPCYRRECPIDHRCLVSIGVEEALAAADRALRRSRRPQRVGA